PPSPETRGGPCRLIPESFSWLSPRHHFARALDRADRSDVGATAAFDAGQPLTNLSIGRLRILPQKGCSGHEPSADSVAALRRLFCNPRNLQRMRVLFGPDTGQRCDRRILD